MSLIFNQNIVVCYSTLKLDKLYIVVGGFHASDSYLHDVTEIAKDNSH